MDGRRYRLISFDLDGTLLKTTSFEAISKAIGVKPAMDEFRDLFEAGKMTHEECYRAQFSLLKGSPIDVMLKAIEAAPKPKNIRETISLLKQRDLRASILSDVPDFICEQYGKFGLQDFICSETEITHGRVWGLKRLLVNKLEGLTEFCNRRGIGLEQCVHVGDWDNDIPVFRNVGLSIALNPKNEKVVKAASHWIETDDLFDVYEILLEHLR